MIAAFFHEQQVKVGDDALRLVINFAALDAIESLTGQSFSATLMEFARADGDVPQAVQARVVWGLLRQHHPELSLDQATTLVIGAAGAQIGMAIAKLLAAAFPPTPAETPKKAKDTRPRKRRGA